MKIYLSRHSKTLWNEEKRLQGRKDSPLTFQGKENALALKKHIQNMSFDYIYTSPIKRAYETSKLIFDESHLIQDDRLMEMNFGEYEGCLISSLKDSLLYYQLWHKPAEFTRIPEGESYDDVIIRAKSFINDLKKHHLDDSIMIMTHGMFFIVLLATMLDLEKKDFVKLNQKVVDGCSLTCINYDGKTFTLDYYNDYSFLPYVANESFSK